MNKLAILASTAALAAAFTLFGCKEEKAKTDIPPENLISAAGAGIFQRGKPIPFDNKDYSFKKEIMSTEGDEERAVFAVYQDGKLALEIFFSNNEKGESIINQLAVFSNKFATAEGIRVGSTVEEFAKAYQNPKIHFSAYSGDTFIGQTDAKHPVWGRLFREEPIDPEDQNNANLSDVKGAKIDYIMIDAYYEDVLYAKNMDVQAEQEANAEETEFITETCLVLFPPTIDGMTEEENPGAYAYYDDWHYHSDNIKEILEKAGIKSVVHDAKKQRVSFQADGQEDYVYDTSDISDLLYKKGKKPISVNIVDINLKEMANYLDIDISKLKTEETAAAAETGGNSAAYKSVKIGEQVWMAENLNIDVPGSKCYDNKPENCTKYGRLYNWNMAMKACPAGWHLPTTAEWDKLYRYVDGTKGTESPYFSSPTTAHKYLKATSGWDENDNGTDKYGFTALPGGMANDDNDGSEFSRVGTNGFWWSATEDDDDGDAHSRCIGEGVSCYSNFKVFFHSVRCLQD